MSRRNLFWLTSVTTLSLVCWHAATSAPADSNYELFRVFVDTLDRVEREYVRELDREELFQGGLIGIVESVDLDSAYLSPAVYQRAKEQYQRQAEHPESIGEIGLHLTLRPAFPLFRPGDSTPVSRQVAVLGVVPGSPAEEAGILPGDLLVDVDETHVSRLTLEEVVQRLQGEPDTEVTLKLFRGPRRRGQRISLPHPEPGEPAPDDTPMDPDMDPDLVNPDGTILVTLKRATIAPVQIMGLRRDDNAEWHYWVDAQKGLAYVRIPAMTRGIAEQLTNRIEQLREAEQHQLKGLVLDLRFCAGGTVAEAVSVADRFLSEGRIVALAGPNLAEQHWDAGREGTSADLPLVVLVNRFTAGPAEVLAAALQDHNRAKVLGERTLGKGGVSRLIELNDNKSALKLTVAAYVRPNGQSLYRRRDAGGRDTWGVKPDEDLQVDQDPQELVRYLRWRSGRAGEEDASLTDYVDDVLAKAAALLEQRPVEAAASS